MPEQSGHIKPVRLAAAAFHAALAAQWERAQRVLKRINDECGEEGVNTALIAWCDTLADHARGGDTEPHPIRVQFWHGDTGQLDEPESERVPAEVRWAGRLIAARAAMDQQAWIAACDDLPEDGLAIGRHVWAVLQLTAWQVNGLPRGYARMGRGGADA